VFSKNLSLQSYAFNNPGSIITSLLQRLGNQLTKSATGLDFLDEFKEQIELFKEFDKSTKEDSKSDYKQLADYINSITQIKGSIFEDDLITNTIRASIEFVKFRDKKECVIVIDDLDRLDPEHIFRSFKG
jgi:hypothetical protein